MKYFVLAAAMFSLPYVWNDRVYACHEAQDAQLAQVCKVPHFNPPPFINTWDDYLSGRSWGKLNITGFDVGISGTGTDPFFDPRNTTWTGNMTLHGSL